MTRPLSMDLRERAMVRLASGESVRSVAAALSVSPSSVVKWSKRLRETAARRRVGSAATWRPRSVARIGTGWWSARAPRRSPCAAWWRSWPSAGLRWTTGRCGSSYAARGSASKKTVLASEQDRPDVARKRVRWKAYQGRVDPRRLVFIDDPKGGEAKRGPRPTWLRCGAAGRPGASGCRAKVPFGHWKTLTFVAALRHDSDRRALGAGRPP